MSKRLELLFQEYRGSGVLASRSEEESAQYEKLTRREAQILRMLAQAATSRNIAAALGISIATTNNHIQHILQKLKAHSRLQAVQKAQKARLI